MERNKAQQGTALVVRCRKVATGVTVADVPEDSVPCRLVYPRFTLPVLAIDGSVSTVELPAADARSSNSTLEARVVGINGINANVQLAGALARPSSKDVVDDDEFLETTIKPAERIAQLVSFHVERCNELVFPSESRGRGRRRLKGITRVDWEQARDIYWRGDDEDGPLRLIVRVADECGRLLGDICSQPRRILRRVRRPTRLERVQQIDDACMRWLARQPGRTWVEKSGPQRRVLAVERVESADTPENRVVRDFLERIVRECSAYLREHQAKKATNRYRLVQRFRTSSIRWLRESEIGSVPRIVGSPTANYVLQFDVRYARIWQWYERLRRQQSAADEAWLWRRRVLVEHVRMSLADAFSHEVTSSDFAKRIYLRTEIDRGWFLDSRSLLGPWKVRSEFHRYLMCSEELPTAVNHHVVPSWMAKYCADLLINDLSDGAAVLIYAQYVVSDDDARRVEDSASVLAKILDSENRPTSCRIVVLLADARSARCTYEVRNAGESAAGRRYAAIAIPWPGEGGDTSGLRQVLSTAKLV